MPRRTFLALGGGTLLLALTSCAELAQESRRQYCDPLEAYQRGYNDGRSEQPMRGPTGCPENRAFAKYQEGYVLARKEQEKLDIQKALLEKSSPPPPSAPSAPVQVIHTNNTGVVVIQSPNPNAAPAPAPAVPSAEAKARQDSLAAWRQRNWLCRVEAITKNYPGWGTSRSEAIASARAHCGEKYPQSFCENATCEENIPLEARRTDKYSCHWPSLDEPKLYPAASPLEALEAAREACEASKVSLACKETLCRRVP